MRWGRRTLHGGFSSAIFRRTCCRAWPSLTGESFVDAALRSSQSDLVFSVQTADSRAARLYLLLEHKSYPDPWVGLQLLGHVVRLWERERRRLKSPPLPAVMPMVLYQGEREWEIPAFGELLDDAGAVAGYAVDFRYGRHMLNAERLERALPASVGESLMTILAQTWMQQGIRQGIEQGERKGMQQGMAHERALILRLAERKFDAAAAGRLPVFLNRIQDPENLVEVADWIMDCDRAEELLARTRNPDDS